MWRHIASNALTFLVVLVFVGGGALIWAQRSYQEAGPLTEPICLDVPRGTNISRVSEDLEGQGAVSSSVLFRLGADYADKSAQLKAGSYLVPEGASMAEIVDIVTRGGASTCGTEVVYRIGVTAAAVEVREVDPATGRFAEVMEFDPASEEPPERFAEVRDASGTRFRVALAEGVTSWQVVEELNSVDVLEGEVEVPAEGSLAPDSYEIVPGDSRADLIDRMQQAQETILAEAWANRADELPLETPADALILASIVEKETGVAEERPQVASVFVNRLRRGMRLQTDPTVIYGITEGEGTLGRGIRQSELRAATPYNTYVIEGLPPTPIANPGRAAIEAALNPAETSYVFFVADGTGGHAFAETLDEHNRNVARWREIEAERASETEAN
ncbi:putative aminodeoxychorismate lyase [Roseivivax jejudonensis]|uniref:Endolytic murein transglycosylase n=1 Tax=Roseivivax jejudonensis TaxID=1529041 RepID=A0A1X6Z8C7_9RHOB|nr:endolytic transglycosylase MltG [Roseivivax jejudonensis]SLN43623.1 putative aminodeoxychorismate lyase [Roseivivax jejudonensis]